MHDGGVHSASFLQGFTVVSDDKNRTNAVQVDWTTCIMTTETAEDEGIGVDEAVEVFLDVKDAKNEFMTIA